MRRATKIHQGEEKLISESWAISAAIKIWKWTEKIIVIEGVAAAVCILAIMCLTTADVVFRYILSKPVKGAYEISEIFFLSAVFLGLSYTQIFREHVNVTLLTSHLSKRVNLILETFMYLLGIAIYGLLAWQGSETFWESFRTGEYRWGLIPIPLWPPRMMVSIGSAFLCLRLMEEVLRNCFLILHRSREKE